MNFCSRMNYSLETPAALIGEQDWWTAESCGCFGEEKANLYLPGIET
jgi:hypothetical protein